MRTRLTLTGAFMLIAVLTVLLFRANSDRARISAELSNARSFIENLETKLRELSNNQLSASDLARLRADQREAVRLRGEVTTLRRSLSEAQSAAGKSRAAVALADRTDEASPLETAPLPEDNPYVRVHKTKLISAQLPAGSSLLIGGWESQPGKRTFALVEPKRDSNGSETITVATRWIEISDEVAKAVRFGSYLDTSGEQSATLAQFSSEEFVKAFEKEEGVDILTTPKVSTVAGRQARIVVTETRTTPAGPVEFGPRLDVVPTVASGGEIGLTLQASYTVEREPQQ